MNALILLLSSRKTWLSLFSTAIATVGFASTLHMLPDPTQKLSAIQAYLYSVAGIWGLNVAAIAHEDASSKSAAPAQQVNVDSNVTTGPTTVDPAKIAAAMADANKKD